MYDFIENFYYDNDIEKNNNNKYDFYRELITLIIFIIFLVLVFNY